MKTRSLICITMSIILMTLFTSLLNAQTNVSGIYLGDTTWVVSGSPYIVVGDVQIPLGVKLTIEPGVRVKFGGNYKIHVQGNLIAVGTASKIIVFDTGSVQTSIMILFRKTNLSNSKISNISFNGSTNAIQLAQESEFNNDSPKNSGVLVVDSCKFDRSSVQTNGNSTTASLSISNSQFISSTIKGVYPSSEPIVIKKSTILNSTIFSDSYNYGINIDSSTVNNSQFKLGCCGANFNITNSNILNSSMYEGGGSPVAGPVKFTNSKIIETPINLRLAGFTISNCILQYLNSSTGAIFGNGSITNTSFVGNNANTALEVTGYSGYNIGGSVNITSSILTRGSTVLKFSNANTVTIQKSNFTNNILYNIENRSSKNIVAQQNYWGTNNNTEIAAKIFDGNDDINYGIVDYSNFLSSPDTSAPISSPSNFLAKSVGDSVRLTWSSNLESDLVGYKIYYSTKSGYPYSHSINVGNVNSYTINGLPYETYYFTITAFDIGADGVNDQIEGHESWFSEERLLTVPENPPPVAPKNLIALSGDKQVLLKWKKNTETDMSRYVLYRSQTSGFTPQSSDSIANVIHPDTTYTNTLLTNRQTYFYKVVAVDLAGNKSGNSNEAIGSPRALPSNTMIIINNNASFTAGTSVSLLLRAVDTDSMKISNDLNFSGVLYQKFDTTMVWTLTNGDGVKKAFAKFKNTTGESSTISDSIILDSTPPSVPLNVTASSGDQEVRLIWNKSSDLFLIRYIIYRSQTKNFIPAPSDSITNVQHPDTAYHDGLVRNGEIYYYKIVAVDAAGNYSVLSNQAIGSPKTAIGKPRIIFIKDVPTDQGKQVFIAWHASSNDGSPMSPVVNYSIWRKDLLWTFIAEVPARSDTVYQVVAPTLIDSTIVSRMHWTMFEVTAHSADLLFATSYIDSGYSIDNLAPYVPDSVGGIITGQSITLKWATPIDGDFKYFAIYRSETPNIDSSLIKPIAFTVKNQFVDSSVVEGKKFYYRISAYDFSGNQSPLSKEVAFVPTLVVETISNTPQEYSLKQNYPNPFNPSTTIGFGLSNRSFVKVQILNTLGQVVANLVQEEKNSGYYETQWNAVNIASGIYFYRIVAISTDNSRKQFIESRRMILLK